MESLARSSLLPFRGWKALSLMLLTIYFLWLRNIDTWGRHSERDWHLVRIGFVSNNFHKNQCYLFLFSCYLQFCMYLIVYGLDIFPEFITSFLFPFSFSLIIYLPSNDSLLPMLLQKNYFVLLYVTFFFFFLSFFPLCGWSEW
jgi:hypothetical protein